MQIHDFFLQLVVILCAARLLGELMTKCQIPSVIGELLAGVIIGPSILGLIESTETIKSLAEIGIVLLLFEIGLETDVQRLAKTASKPFIVAAGGVILPFIFGFLVSDQIFHLNLMVSLFIASTLTATSIGITMRVLADLKQQASDEAQIVLGAAVIDDVIGIILLAVLYEFTQSGTISMAHISMVVFFIVLFLALAPIFAKMISSVIRKYEAQSSIPGILPASIIALILFFAWLAHQMNAPTLLGGFAAGLAFAQPFFMPLGNLFHISREFSQKVETQMKPIAHLFIPIFFVNIGLSLNLQYIDWSSSFIWMLSLCVLIAAILGKLSAGFLLFKENKWMKWSVGMAMIPRGEVGLIFAEIGHDNKIFNGDLYASMIIVIAITTIVTPFAMRFLYNLKKSYENQVLDAPKANLK